MTQDTLELIATRVSKVDIKLLDRIAERQKVNRSIVVRWAIDAYIKSFFSPDYLLKEQKETPVTSDPS